MTHHSLAHHFESRQVQAVIEEAMLYTCACPAQLGVEILRLRELYTYQQACITKGETMLEVHQRIAEAAREAHDILEACLSETLKLEGWDLITLKMPAGLREIQQRVLDQD